MIEGLADTFENEIKSICRHFDATVPQDRLLGIGLMCDDEVSDFAAYFLSASMLSAEVEADYRFNPMDWESDIDIAVFAEVNLLLKQSGIKIDDSKFPQYARCVFDSGIEALARLNLHERYGSELFITMGGADPTDLLEREEYRFVERVNSPTTYETWLRDYA